jgi:hypothetical protein
MAIVHEEIAAASLADLAADLAQHRATWITFLKLAKWVVIAASLLLIVVFFIELSIRTDMVEEGAALGGAPPLPGKA